MTAAANLGPSRRGAGFALPAPDAPSGLRSPALTADPRTPPRTPSGILPRVPALSRSSAFALGALALVVAAELVIRAPSLRGDAGFFSHDVGGILYCGMLLRAGGLPYVDAIEYKAPGAFYLAALFGGPEGRDIGAVQVAANLTAIASLLALAALAWRLWGPRAALAAALVYALHDAFIDSMDANYVTWAQLPQVLAGLCAVVAASARPARRTRELALWVAAGVCCGLAALCKQPSGVILVPVLAWAFLAPGRRDPAAALAVLLGGALAHVPIGLHYLARGHLGDLFSGYIFNEWGYGYITSRSGTPALRALWLWISRSALFLALPLLLAGFALAARPRRAQRPPEPVPGATTFLIVWALAALAAAAVGFRFYKGYFLAPLPPLCLLAAAPAGLLSRETWRRGQPVLRRAARWGVLLLALVLAARAGVQTYTERALHRRPSDTPTRAIGQYIGARTAPDDRIWVWGWHLWGVYAYSGRLSASRLYKTLGYLTPMDSGTGPFLKDSPYAALLMDELRADPPAYVVTGGTVPRAQFTELRRFLTADYVLDPGPRIKKVEIWRRKDLPRR